MEKVSSYNFAAVISRPDIALAASMLSEHLQNSSPNHVEAANYCLFYLHSTQGFAITYSGTNHENQRFAFANTGHAQISSDASFADDQASRKSCQGYIFSLFGGNCLEGIEAEYSDNFEHGNRATGSFTGWKGDDMVGELLP